MAEPVDLACPRCRGSMKPVYLGELRDKHFECEYCGHVLDVADRSSVTHEEIEDSTDARGNRVRRVKRVTRTRVDPGTARAAGGRAFQVDLGDLDGARAAIADELGGELPDEVLQDALRQALRDAPDLDGAELGELLHSGWTEIEDLRVEVRTESPEPEPEPPPAPSPGKRPRPGRHGGRSGGANLALALGLAAAALAAAWLAPAPAIAVPMVLGLGLLVWGVARGRA